MSTHFWTAWVLVLILFLGLAGVSFAKKPAPVPSMDDILRHSRVVPYDHDGAWPPNDL